MKVYYRPLVQTDRCRAPGAVSLAGGWAWFSHAERLVRGQGGQVVSVAEMPAEVLDRFTAKRADICGVSP